MWLWPKFVSVLEPRVTSNPGLRPSTFSNPSHFLYVDVCFREWTSISFFPGNKVAHTKVQYLPIHREQQVAEFVILQWYSTAAYPCTLQVNVVQTLKPILYLSTSPAIRHKRSVCSMAGFKMHYRTSAILFFCDNHRGRFSTNVPILEISSSWR